MKNPIPIFFACNDKYVPYLDVAIISLISHASPDREYRIIVLKTDITAQNQEVILTRRVLPLLHRNRVSAVRLGDLSRL